MKVRPEIYAEAVARARWRCEKCRACGGSSVTLELHHVLGRRPEELVNDPDNLVLLCKRWGWDNGGCHEWMHGNKTRALVWFESHRGVATLERLQAIRRGSKHVPR